MSFIDNIGKRLGEGVDWAKEKAERFQRTFKLEGELNDLRKQLDAKRLEFSDRALDLYRAGQIQSPSLTPIVQGMDSLRVSVTLKEEELRRAQAESAAMSSASAPPPTPSSAQSVPISVEPVQPTAPAASTTATKICTNCGFEMPGAARFCPKCGTRVA